MASRRTTTVVVRGRSPSPMSPASRQLLIRVRQRQACRSALLIMGLLGIILVTILSMTVAATRKKDVPVGRIRRLQGSLLDFNNSGQHLMKEQGLRGESTKIQTYLGENSPTSISDVKLSSNSTMTTSEETPEIAQT